jgi:hypothetical protein
MKSVYPSLALICQLVLLFLLLALIIKPSTNLLNAELSAFGVVFVAFYWACLIIKITITKQLQLSQKISWLIIAVSTPLLGVIIYQLT